MQTLNYSKKQLSPIIEKYKINVATNSNFKAIIMLFDGQTNYQIWATKAVFGGVVNLEVIENIKMWADANQTEIQNLIKGNIVSYKTAADFAQLHKEIVGLNNIGIVKREVSKFNTDQRKEFMDEIFKNVNNGYEAHRNNDFAKWVDLFKKFSSLNQKTQKKLIISVSAFRGNIQAMVDVIKGAFETRYEWNKDDLLGFMARNCDDCSVVFDNDHIVIARIGSYDSSVKLCGNGRTTWCITNRKSYWDSYVGNCKDRSQYFLWDFSKREDHELAHVGFTVSAKDGIVEAQSTQNSCLRGSGMEIDGKRWTIDDVFAKNNIPTDIYIKLGELKNFKWTIDSFLEYAKGNQLNIVYDNDKRIIVAPKNEGQVKGVIAHTLINNSRSINNSNQTFIVLDFNEKKDSANSITCLYYNNDRYGIGKFASAVNAFSGNVTSETIFSRLGIKETDFINTDNIDAKILLHKYLDDKNEEAALRIIEEKGDSLDINYIHNQTAPIFTAIDSHLLNAFAKLYTHKNFNKYVANAYAECILAHLMYDYVYTEDTIINLRKSNTSKGTIKNTEEELNAIKTMINIVLDDGELDVNYINYNLDTPINIACETPSLLWVVERLIKNPNVNLNQLNDYNFAALGNAIRNKNVDAIQLLGTRTDLVIREEDKNLAKRMGIKLDEYINPTVKGNDVKSEISQSEEEVIKYRALFETVFGGKI